MASVGEVLDEDEIDGLKMPKVIRLCKENGIDLTGKPTIDEMKLELKLKLLCREKEREREIAKLHSDYELDEIRRRCMTELYEKIAETTRHVMRMDDPVVRELQQTFPDIDNVLRKEIVNLQGSHAPILVLGETGAGKSSFINLLLQQDILPSSMLSNTHVVCEIKYADNYSAILYPLNDEPKPVSGNQGFSKFREELGTEIQRLNRDRGVYKKAEIFLPCDILKSGVVLVDSPGIGENKEMENTVLDYILNACTFIYVIASDSAGGMQQRMQNLLQKVYQKAIHEQKVYQPERAIFICNKWDQVQPKERKEVKEDTIRKITQFWPSCKESQIFTFSTKEANEMQKRSKMSPKFQLVMQEINKLVPLGREIQIIKSYKYLDYFVTRCLHCFDTNLAQIKMSVQERQKKQKETMDRLQILKGKVESYFVDQDRALKQDIIGLADKMKDFLREDTNMESICKFTKSDFAAEKEWKTVAVAIRAKVYERITELIKGWEDRKGEFKKIGDRISKSLEEEFPKFTAEIFKVQRNLSSIPLDEHQSEDESLVPDLVRKQFEGLNFGMKVAVGIGLAPVLFLGMAIRLPVYGLKALKKSISDLMMQSDFKKSMGGEEEQLFEKYARSTVNKITDKLELQSVIEADIQPLFHYLHQQRAKIDSLINSDLQLLQQMKEDARNEYDIQRTYSPLKDKFLMLQLELENFLFTNMPKLYSRDYTEYPSDCLQGWHDQEPICHGLAAKIFPAKLEERLCDGSFKNVCVRITSETIKATNIKDRKKVLDAYRTIKKSFIVTFLGLSVAKLQRSEPYLVGHYQIIEPLQGNLRNVLQTELEEFSTKDSKRTFLQGAMQQIVHGLKYLHDRVLVHFDLSQDTIAVNLQGNIKLTNICTPKRLHIKPEYIDGKVDMSKYIYIPEKFIFCKERSGSQSSMTSSTEVQPNSCCDKYGPKDDMFGVGMLMWEIWVGKPLYTDNPMCKVDDKIMNDTEKFRKLLQKYRPKKNPHFVSTPDSEDQIMSEWWTTIHGCIERKLDASDCLIRWEEIRSSYPAISLIYSRSHFSMSPKYD